MWLAAWVDTVKYAAYEVHTSRTDAESKTSTMSTTERRMGTTLKMCMQCKWLVRVRCASMEPVLPFSPPRLYFLLL